MQVAPSTCDSTSGHAARANGPETLKEYKTIASNTNTYIKDKRLSQNFSKEVCLSCATDVSSMKDISYQRICEKEFDLSVLDGWQMFSCPSSDTGSVLSLALFFLTTP
jgi:hypothetical protein